LEKGQTIACFISKIKNAAEIHKPAAFLFSSEDEN